MFSYLQVTTRNLQTTLLWWSMVYFKGVFLNNGALKAVGKSCRAAKWPLKGGQSLNGVLVQSEIRTRGPFKTQVTSVECDLQSFESVRSCAAKMKQMFGELLAGQIVASLNHVTRIQTKAGDPISFRLSSL